MIKKINTNIGNFIVFANKNLFVQHLKKHVLSDEEPWDRVFTRKQLKEFCQLISEENVLNIYINTCDKIKSGMLFSINKPIYAIKHILNQKIVIHYFISEKGFVIIAENYIIKTFYFVSDNKNISNRKLFKNAWKAIKKKMYKLNYHNENINKTFNSTENWTKCPLI